MFPIEGIDQIPGVEEGQLKKFKVDLAKMTFAAAIGIKDDYLIVTMGPDLTYLSSIGKGDSIASIKEMAPLAKHAGKNIIGMQYYSKEFLETAQSYGSNPEEASNQVKELIAGANLPKDISKRIEKDVDALTKEAFEFAPKIGARVGVVNQPIMTSLRICQSMVPSLWACCKTLVAVQSLQPCFEAKMLKKLGTSSLNGARLVMVTSMNLPSLIFLRIKKSP